MSVLFISSEINVVKFLESRSREMEAMRQSAVLVSTNARVMQQLPRHMRRRAASHNVKRLPRHLRLEAEKEVASPFADLIFITWDAFGMDGTLSLFCPSKF